ncbi:hypothetical protein [Paraburkholderia fungorum]|uniref:Uncharacterized protein n=1 Tax=Paraburkholderia fungorum TaxID=134537 RepID=A0AAW3V123_9BURK|nr:hypothetical protein [Paraburkholderia fungorum]MBB4515487.1 hypothetical protein [Paraburkholderia fungorum]MBB6203430.1 hypothetical protein [Paraburkholderia fungorum]USX07380.1 hypothetical protein NHH62_32820 [Paraburkholderia fungorum]
MDEPFQSADDRTGVTRHSFAAEVTARSGVSNIERGPVLENESFHNPAVVNRVNGIAFHEDTGAFVGQNQLQQRTELLHGVEKAGFARSFRDALPINKSRTGVAGVACEKAQRLPGKEVRRRFDAWDIAHGDLRWLPVHIRDA